MLRLERLSVGGLGLARGCLGFAAGHVAWALAAYAATCLRFGTWLAPADVVTLCSAAGPLAGLHVAAMAGMVAAVGMRD